nr:uncharacterized protein LOC124217226 [Neodiprion pinetum]
MSEDCCPDQSKIKVITIDFGHVIAGRISKRTVKIVNETYKKQHYKVHRDPTTNCLDYVFNVEFHNWTLPAGGFTECKIEYQPAVPSHCYIDYFSITDCDRICYKLCVQGTCIGPYVVPSVSRLVMVCPKGVQEVRKRLQLTNDSEAAATFMFDIDEKCSSFKLDITKGIIAPHSHAYVSITFSPEEQQIYALYLPCLILHQGPIVTELYGYRGPLFSKAEEFVPVLFAAPKPLIGDFDGYMSDVVQVRKGSYPPISLSESHLDFGRGNCDDKKNCQCLPQDICFMNHTDTDMTVKWSNGRGDFSLVNTSSFYKGHTFSPGSNGWIPQFEVPRTVILPPTLPLFPVYTTFLIKLHGHLAMTFKFIPPPTTHFTVKPMVGIIHRGYQIVALHMFPEVQNKLFYIERWTIEFNGNPNNKVPIEFKAYAEFPRLDFSNNNLIEFAPVYPLCEQTTQVTMRNTTRHCIRYSFPEVPSEIKVEKASGVILGNEILMHDWIFCPKDTGDYKYTICCRATALKAGKPVGNSVDTLLEVTGKAECGYLVALPEELNFGTVAYGQTKKLSFHMFNFSLVKIHFELRCNQRGWPLDSITHEVKIKPVTDTIIPGSNKEVEVEITPHKSGFYQLVVQYLVQSNSSAKHTSCTLELQNICIVNCMCILPGFEVIMSDEDTFNTIINSIEPGHPRPRVVKLRFPELVLCQEPLLIKLLVVNSTPTHSTWTITRIKKCDCKQVTKHRGLTFKYKEYCCDHRLACTISPNKGVLQPRQKTILTVKVCYRILGKTSLEWKLVLSNNRNIIINADVVALSEIEPRPSLVANQVFSMERIYIGDIDAIKQVYFIHFRVILDLPEKNVSIYRQMCWLYNSLDQKVTYSLDISPLYQLNAAALSGTFACTNPQGTLPGQSYYPIIFKFQPRRFESYQITLPLKLGDTMTNLSIVAKADISQKTRFLTGKVPTADQFSIPELPICFSVDFIVISPMPMHSKADRMIMIYNESKNDVIGYQWKKLGFNLCYQGSVPRSVMLKRDSSSKWYLHFQMPQYFSYEMPNVLDVRVMPISGRIQPAKAHSFCIRIRSLSHPCKITANLSCQFLNLSAQRVYEKSVLVYNTLCTELDGHFIITEKGTSKPKPWLERAQKPVSFYKSLSISCYIYSVLDADLKTTLDEQLKSSPSVEIRTKKNESCTSTDPKLIDIATFVLEGMIWDILNGNLFINNVKENLTQVPNVKYGQYKMSPTERRKLQDRSYIVPPKHFLESIFEQMIFGIVHEEFGLSLCHFVGPEDIRQFYYQKRETRTRHFSKMNKLNMQGIFKPLTIVLKMSHFAKLSISVIFDIFLFSQNQWVNYTVKVSQKLSQSNFIWNRKLHLM